MATGYTGHEKTKNKKQITQYVQTGTLDREDRRAGRIFFKNIKLRLFLLKFLQFKFLFNDYFCFTIFELKYSRHTERQTDRQKKIIFKKRKISYLIIIFFYISKHNKQKK